jgi:hypothetical protein
MQLEYTDTGIVRFLYGTAIGFVLYLPFGPCISTYLPFRRSVYQEGFCQQRAHDLDRSRKTFPPRD